eukprot:scaffold71102_cov48-Cyclotella_meneghiniana.AAC.2
MNTAAAIIHKNIYTLGRSLYIPITCRCNSIPLPVTRGPGFLLPKSITDALVSVRNVECGEHHDVPLLNTEEERAALPDYPKKWLVNCLHDDLHSRSPSASEDKDTTDGYVLDDRIHPSITTLTNEAISYLNNKAPEHSFEQIVIAGEGEPTLRMDALLSISHQIQSYRKSQNEPPLPIRLITNGLVYTIPNFGYSPYNPRRNGAIPHHRHTVLRDMLEAGISRISVALNTNNRHEYDVLMEPCCFTSGNAVPGMAHDMVCEFILEAGKVGFDVEITGIDRPDIDKYETDRLARMLLSVAQRKKTNKVRWRQYFE